jgi:hypothetical protein
LANCCSPTDSFDKFVKDGSAIVADGGLFHIEHDAAGRFSRAIIQPALYKQFAESCGDYVQVDGTLCMCHDDKVLLGLVVVDGLNRGACGFCIDRK